MRRLYTSNTFGRSLVIGSTLALVLTGCSVTKASSKTADAAGQTVAEQPAAETDQQADTATTVTTNQSETTANVTSTGVIDAADLFTSRDLQQVADTSDATTITLTNGEDVQITQEGTYVLTGSATEVTVRVDVDSSEKVQLVLDGTSITNTNKPCIYVVNADKVFVTTVEGTTSTLAVTEAFVADGETNTDAVIFSKDDLVLNGLGTLVVNSTDNGITSKDDLKVTGGTYEITCQEDALEAKDSIAIADGNLTINTPKDGLHAENDDDDTVGYVYICGGTLNITAGDDGIHATTYLQVDDGNLTIDAEEALEATYVQVNGGELSISASDDGINASNKSQSLGTPTIEITGGKLSITMAQGDTDALDANGNLLVSGGTIDITAQFAFDFDGQASYTGGTITVNGEQVSEITNSMMMGGPMGGMGPGMMDGGPGMGQQGGPGGPRG